MTYFWCSFFVRVPVECDSVGCWKGFAVGNDVAGGRHAADVVRVMEYNLHGETHGWGPNHFVPADPVGELDALDADVFVFPETWVPDDPDAPRSHIVRWAEHTGKSFHLARSSRSSPREVNDDFGESHVAIVTSLPVVDTKQFTLPVHPKDNSDDRNVLAVLIDAGSNGHLWVVGVHMSARVPHVPVHNLRKLNTFVTELERTGHPVIIAGDFNLWGWWVRCIHRGGYRRAVRGRTWPATKPHSQIDHILVPATVTVAAGKVLPAGFSDHRAIWADLKVHSPTRRPVNAGG
jgi:endonuclease/exonuclease/phosphatase family metal-dependent hydrolase